MTDQKYCLESQKIGETVTLENDGYIGIPVRLSVYFDKANHTVRCGYHGTPVILYVLHTRTERVGTDSDEDILRSMLERGYIAVTVDYQSHEKAVRPAIDWSVQCIRARVKNKEFFTDPIFPQGIYYENHVIPAGYNVSLWRVYWEADKHGADGTLEFIVKNWNSDFRGARAEQIIPWVHEDGRRKATAAAADGSEVVWYNADGEADAEGKYTKIKYTVAETVSDCVKPDGSPIDLKLCMHLYYPTHPAGNVPVLALANSSQYMTDVFQHADRPHFAGFLFGGYAGVVFDHLYVPMEREDAYHYYDGNPRNTKGAVTGDQWTYSIHPYNDKRVDTAAIRYIRYLSLSDHDTFAFNNGKIGYMGLSKGGWMVWNGEEMLQHPFVENAQDYESTCELEKAVHERIVSPQPRRCLAGYASDTRYDAGKTEIYTADGLTVHGGELQPWLTYEGKEILSGVQMVYANNGGNSIYITKGHAPTVLAAHMNDTFHAAYSYSNEAANLCRTLDIPSLFFEVPLAHTKIYGTDLHYGVDTYTAHFAFMDYYLKESAVQVVWTDPMGGSRNVPTTKPITVKFTGGVKKEELSKITLSDSAGQTAAGEWQASCGNTEWKFSPDCLHGGTEYTLRIPDALAGDNGKELGEDRVLCFTTAPEETVLPQRTESANKEIRIWFPAPDRQTEQQRCMFRFRVTNHAANTALVYAADTLLGKVHLRGAGFYELDITPYTAKHPAEALSLRIRTAIQPGQTETIYQLSGQDLGGCEKSWHSEIAAGEAPDGTPSLKAIVKPNTCTFTDHTFYYTPTRIFTHKTLFKDGPLTEEDYGRRFTVRMRVYDPISRYLCVHLTPCTDRLTYQTLDYDWNICNFTTKAGQWTSFSFDYDVYDTDYGPVGLHQKELIVSAGHDGCRETPLYFDEITVTETITEMETDSFTLVYRAPENGG